jgi:hypothetical protein
MSAPLSDLEYIAAHLGRKPIKAPHRVEVRCNWPAGMDRQIAQARADMGEERWAALQAEWAA